MSLESSNNAKIDLLSMSLTELADHFSGKPKYLASEVFKFLHEGKSFDDMTSLKKDLRAHLGATCVSNPVQILEVFTGSNGTKKFLFKLIDDELIEGVFMPHNYGNTLCLSTQIGCRMGCKFCASGLDGLKRNLSAGEMLGQIIAVNHHLGGTIKDRQVDKIVLMGSGEPFDNYDNLLRFLDLLSEPSGINIGDRNISISTSGLANKVREFAHSGHKVTLSISLHTPFDTKRSELMPVNRKFNVQELIGASKYYFENTGRRVVFEYTLIKGENDTYECATALKNLLGGFPAHINLIKLNKVEETKYDAPSDDTAQKFLKTLEGLNMSATIRKSLGGDIEGACGQLRRRYISNRAKF